MVNETKQSIQHSFHSYLRKGYAAFMSLGRQVRIGVLSVAMLVSQQVVGQQVSSTMPTARDIHQEDEDQKPTEEQMEEIVVAATMSPVATLRASRPVTIISRSAIERTAASTVNDLLKAVANVDVRQRGAFSAQTDISIDGGTFDQVAILLNGIPINNPQTGHHAMDLPLSTNDIERIEIIEGAASRVYGTSAFLGAINIVTRQPKANTKTTASAAIGAGSWGTVCGDISAGTSTNRSSHYFSVSGLRTDGGTMNSDMGRLAAFGRGSVEWRRGTLGWQLSASDKKYGANTFYSPRFPDQWEANTRYMLSLDGTIQLRRQSPTLHLRPHGYWQHNTDHFQLVRGTNTGENHHISDVIGGGVALQADSRAGQTTLSADVRHERIRSTNLGHIRSTGFYSHGDSRTQVDVSINHSVKLSRLTLSAGLVATMHTANGYSPQFYPGIDLSFDAGRGVRLYANYNRGFRLPTFTDMYYSGAERQGSDALREEQTHSVNVGVTASSRYVNISGRLFYHRGLHMIDWVKYSAEDPVYYAGDFNLHNLGGSLHADIDMGRAWHISRPLTLSADYAYIYQHRDNADAVYKSSYAGEYLRHKFTASLTHPLPFRVSATWSLRVCRRTGAYEIYDNCVPTGRLVSYSPYAVLDARIMWQWRKLILTVSAENITNHRYYDLGNIPQPGACVQAGVRIAW